MNSVSDCSQKWRTAENPQPHGSSEGPLTRLFWDGLFVCFLQFQFCLTIEILISAVRRSRVLPVHKLGEQYPFQWVSAFLLHQIFPSEASAANLVAMPLDSGLATAQLDQFSRRIAPDRIERSRNRQMLV
jgi:hypothetical protein